MVYKKMNRREFSELEEGPTEERQDFAQSGESRGGGSKFIIAVIVIVLVLAAGGYALSRYTSFNFFGLVGKSQSASTDWQAVFLSNGQVYFGKIKSQDDRNVVLADIYYLQVVSKPLQTTKQGQTAAAATAAADQQQELTLIKLGNELHGPVDEMIINRDQVLLTERLKADSRVVTAIDNYLAQQAAAAKK